MKKQKRILAFLLALSMFSTTFFSTFSKVMAITSYDYTAETNLGTYTTGSVLNQGSYYLNSDLTFDGSSTGNGLKIAEGATVVIYLNGHTLTAIGDDAGTSENKTTQDYGYAGILLPSTSTLIFAGEGTVNAYGGDAGNGSNGGNGGSAGIYKSSESLWAGSGGNGGNGGGGAGAGIGTNGSYGGAGGSGHAGFYNYAPEDDNCNEGPYSGNNGSNSANVSNAGRLLVYSNNAKSSSITMNLVGGSAGTRGTGGSAGTNYYDKGTSWDNDYTASAGSAGGGGAAGAAGSSYGVGGVGGAGGAGGASGAVYSNSGSGWFFKYGKGGQGGKGATSALNGTDGSWANSSSKVGYDGSASYSGDSFGSVASGGNIGTTGTAQGYTTYHLNGLYARISALDSNNKIVTYKCGDYVSKDDVDVYAIYSLTPTDTVSNTVGRIELRNGTTDGFSNAVKVNGTNSDSIRAFNIGKDYWSFETCETSGDHIGEHLVNKNEIISVTSTNTNIPLTGKINVKLNSNMFANCSSFVRDYRIAMDTQQTINKEAGTDATAQASADTYTTYGEGATYNTENTIKVINYDNKAHTIAEIIKDSEYGTNTGNLDITDEFFKNGLNTNATDENSYWYNGYAQTPYYKVEYKPYRSFVDYDATNATSVAGNVSKNGDDLTYSTDNYLTGTSAAAIKVGDEVTGKYADNVNLEYGSYVLNGDTDTYFAAGQINKELIKNAGEYTVTVVVPYRYFTYTYTDGSSWYGDTVSTSDYSYFFHTYVFNIIVRKADLAIKEATDTVYENTKVQSHMYNRYAEGQNYEEVYGTYTYASAFGEEWGNSEDRVVNENHKSFTDIEWEFNIYEDEYVDPNTNTIDGQKNMNNYLCQVDGISAEQQAITAKDVQNTYYSGNDGVLIYTDKKIATRNADMALTVNYEKDQKVANTDNIKTASEDLDSIVIASNENDITVKSIYAEDIEFTANITSDALGWRVVKGDAVTGTKTSGTKIESASDLAEGYNTSKYYDKIITDDKYNGDFYAITVKAGTETIKYVEYFDDTAENTVTNIKSVLAKQVVDDLPACEYYGVDEYDVTVEYVGLYYTSETAPSGRNADWDGTEEFNWVTSKIEFKLDIEQREVSVKPLNDVDKIYDSTPYVVSQTLTTGDVTGTNKYIVNLNKANTSNTQFAKLPGTALYNYIDPTDDTSNSMDIELAGTYSDKNKGANKEVEITEARWLSGDTIPISGDKVASLNYVIVDGNGETDGIATLSGDISVAQMHFSHILSGTVIVREYTPLHEIFEISNKAYLLTLKTEDKTNYVKEATMALTELVEKDDVKSEGNNSFETNSEEYDYDAKYVIDQSTTYKQYIKGSTLVVDNDTGRIVDVATVTKGGTNPVNFPAMDVSLVGYSNFHVVPAEETVDTDVYNTCSITGTNDCTTSDEILTHIIRFRIIGNNNSYDLILPINQLNNRPVDSAFLKRTGDTITVDTEIYNYVAVYPNDSDVEFEFTIPQDSYLEDLAIVALPDYKTYDTTATFKTLDELTTLAKAGTGLIGTFATQSETNGMNNSENPIYMTLDAVNGVAPTSTTAIDTPNNQIGGSTFKFTLATGECNLGENYAIALVPLTAEYDQNILADDAEEAYVSNISIEKTITSSSDSTLIDADENYLYVNYKTLFDTTANGKITLSYDGVEDLELALPANNMNEFNSFAINTADYASFFNPATLIPGTKVTITLETWRNGVVDGMQNTGDNDAFDTATMTWTVTEEEYKMLFAVTFTITFDANGGTGTMNPVIVEAGDYKLPNSTFTAPSGKTFDKWNLGKSGITINVSDNVTLVAQWKAKTVAPVSGGGSSGGSSSGSYKITNKEETTENNVWENASEWAIPELKEANEKGLIPKTFEKKDFTKEITRKDFAAVAVKLYEALTGTEVKISISNPFRDTDDAYVIKAYELGITNGTDEGIFTPDMEITREQMATMLTRALEKAGIIVNIDMNSVSKFADDSSIHEWGRRAVYFMANTEIIKGIGDNTFGSLGKATIEQALAIVLRSVNVFAK